VVFVATAHMEDIKRYGYPGFAAVARHLLERSSRQLRFPVVTADDGEEAKSAFADLPVSVLARLDAADCVDLFGSAGLVIGSDTGLTHLAALTVREEGGGPQVVGLYACYSHGKWITGSYRHHALATPLCQMLALSDADLWLDGLDGAAWGAGGSLTSIPPRAVAEFAGDVAGLW
jgi:ADP-heptose:LPS heptosyltransferase